MVKPETMAVKWTSEESLRLLTLFDTQIEWPQCAETLNDEFASKRPNSFFTAKSCKDEFERIISTGHPEHFIRQKGEKYSQKELVKAWITYMQKQVKADAARETEMLLIKMREKAEIFNRIFSEDNPLSDDEIGRLLEEARMEDSKRDPEVVNREVAAGMEKIAELQALHQSDPEKYPPLRIIIPPSRPSASSAAPFSPIKPLFDGLTPPPMANDSKITAASSQSSPSTGMSLRSASHSPQKTALASPHKESKGGSQQETRLRSPQRQTVGGLQKGVTESSRKEHPASPQKGASGNVQKGGTTGFQKSGRMTSLGSPQRPASLAASPRSSLGML
ncbi:hypothetical protein Tcan_10844 [Toxocara canis]|uniref:Uncharacterized protein n=1 Tax=Toxocara canis TaxID=6265 RepID=A0A0B2UUY3_TOXCA|nr:hypothetical protein Tcan_10844 [Toxocara canis]